MKKFLMIFFCLSVLLTGCNNDRQINVFAQNEEEEKTVDQILNDTKEVYAGTALFVEDDLLVAIQVNPWIGFKEQKIEKKLQEKLEKQYPTLNVLVSTDYKLFWESNQLMKEADNEKIAEEVKKLKELEKEET